MATTFQIADDDVRSLGAHVMREYHPDLATAGVRVAYLFALNPNGPAVKHGGYPVLACIKIVATRDRLTKAHDAEVLIDETAWEGLSDEQRTATLDHELSHIRLKNFWKRQARDKDGNPIGEPEPGWDTDDLGRPALKSVPGDWSAGDGFAAVVARHGADAIEFRNLATCRALAERARAEGIEGREAA